MRVSVVCPFYNEAQILESAVRTLLDRLRSLDGSWELIVVNDGSTDGSAEIAQRIAKEESSRLRVLGYATNRGRGHALRAGIAAARGDIIVTTEIDLSWGEQIVHELVAAMERWPDADIVVASPNLPSGGYKNVPLKRVWLSRIGNRVIRACMSNAVTMNTGMTRAYRRQVIQSLPLSEDEKEFHLEVILKATAFGFRIREVPAVLQWKEYKHQGQRIKRKSSSRVNRLIVSHSLFSIFANPVRYVWTMSGIALALGVRMGGAALRTQNGLSLRGPHERLSRGRGHGPVRAGGCRQAGEHDSARAMVDPAFPAWPGTGVHLLSRGTREPSRRATDG
jgi:dolichol-phosphate mannosyltransferase